MEGDERVWMKGGRERSWIRLGRCACEKRGRAHPLGPLPSRLVPLTRKKIVCSASSPKRTPTDP